jgi:hypothetical protein
MSTAYTQDDVDDIENNLLEAEANLQSYVDSSVQTFRTNAIYRMNPWMGSTPETVMQMAAMDIDNNTLINNAAMAWGMQRSSTLADDLRNKLPSTQRAIFASLSPAQQANLQKMGYQVPKGNDTTKSWYDGPLGTATAPFRWSVSDVLLPRGADLLNGLTYTQDLLVGRNIRTLSDLSTPTKIAAGAGGLAAGYVGFAAATAMSLNPYMAIGLAGFSALAGATASAFLVETIQGNPSRFINSWRQAGEGEKFFTQESVNKATELLGDEGLITLAQTFAQQLGNQTDLVALVREMAGQRDAMLPEKQFDQILKIAETIAEPNTDAYFQTVAALETIIQEPIFQEAIVTLQQGKVSLGRIAARGLGLNPNSGEYNFISGMVDAATMIAMDPTLLLGVGVKAFKVARYGIEFADGAVMANKFQEMYSSKKAIQRVFDVVAKGVVNGDSRVIARYTPQWLPIYDQLRTYYNAVKEMPDFAGFDGQQVVNFITDGQRFSSIMQGIGITQGTTRQTLKTLGAGNYLLRSSGGVVGDFLRGAGDASIYSVIEKISKNADFQKDLINFIPLELREDFLQLINNTEMSNAYKAGLKLAEAPGIGAVLRPIGAFKEGLVTPALTKQAITLIDKPEAVKDITDLVRSFNQIGLSSFMQDIWIKTIIDNPNFQGRVDAIAAMIDSLATAGNLRQTRAGSDYLDEILTHFKQHYAFGKAGSMSTKTGYWKMDKVGALPIRDAQSIMIALPDMKLLREATANGTWFRTLLNIPETQYIQTFQNKIWKPAVLFKYGFALRNSGEDILAMIARAGSGYFMQELAGRSIGNYDARLEAKLVLDEFMKTGPNVRKGARLTERQKWLLYKQYDVPTHIRPLVRAISRLGSGKDPKYVIGKNYGKWLATFLRGSKRQDTALVDLMKYFRSGAQSAADRTFLENLSLSPSIIKDNFRTMGDMLIYGNEYSWRRMLVGGVDQRKVIAGKLWAEENIVALMDRLGTGAGMPFDLDVPTLANQREFGGKTQVRLSNGERGVVRHGEQNRLLEDFHVSHHERTSELSDDPLISQVKQNLLKVYSPDLQEIVPPNDFKSIINEWKTFLESSTDELGAVDALQVQMWFILNEPLEHPERVRRYQAILNQIKGSPLHKELVSRYGGLKVPTPQEYLRILSDQINVDPSAIARLGDVNYLVQDIPEPAKTWVMANLYQDWATDGQHFGPEFTRWNGQSVGRSKGQPIYRAMQRPGEQYVINPDGSITLFFQDQSHWEDAEALSMSLSYEQTLKYLGGIFTRGQPVGRDVIFTSTVDDVFGAHGITKNDVIWRDYERTNFGWDDERGRPIRFPERGAAFVQGPEGPYQITQPEQWTYNAQSGRRELALHAEIKLQHSPMQAVFDRRNSLQEQVQELNDYLASDQFMDDTLDLQMTYDDYDSEEAANQAMDAIHQKISDQIDPLVEEIANLNVTLRENGFNPEDYGLPRGERNSITIPAGSYTLSYPSDVDNFIETSPEDLLNLIDRTTEDLNLKVKDLVNRPEIVDELDHYFKVVSKLSFDNNQLNSNISTLRKIRFDTTGPFDDEVILQFSGGVWAEEIPYDVNKLYRVDPETGFAYVTGSQRDFNDPDFPDSPLHLGHPTNNSREVRLSVDAFAKLLDDVDDNITKYVDAGLDAEWGINFDVLNNASDLNKDLNNLNSLRNTRAYLNNELDQLGPMSSRIAHLLSDEQVQDINLIIEDLDNQLLSARESSFENGMDISASDESINNLEKQRNLLQLELQMHQNILDGKIKPGEIFADYSTSPFYSSFDEIESSLDMELARIIESGEFDDALNLNRRVVDTGPTQEVFVIDLSNLPPYLSEGAAQKLFDYDKYKVASRTPGVEGDIDSAEIFYYGNFNRETPVALDDGSYDFVPKNIRELMYQAIETRSPLVFSTEEAANFYLKQMNQMLESIMPYKPKGSVARNLEQTYFIPEVKPMYLPVMEPEAILDPNVVSGPIEKQLWSATDETQLFGGSSQTTSIPFARKRYSTPSRSRVQQIIKDPNFTDTPVEAFDVIGWPVDNYPVVSDYLYDAATQGSQPQIIEAARETIKQRVKAGRRIDYTAKRDGSLWILNEGRPMELKAGDVLPSTKVFSDPRMAEEDLVNLGDMRFMDESEIRYGGDADINWHTIAPLLYDDAEKLSGRKLYEGTQSASIDGKEVYLDNLPVTRFSLHDVQNSPAGNLPNLEIASVYEDIPSGSLGFDKVVQFGFGKILGPIMDAISRKPMAFHAFSIALERNLKNIDWMLYQTPEELALNALADVFHSKSIFGPQSPKTLDTWSNVGRQVGLSHGMPEAEFWSAGEAISYIRGFNGEELDLALEVLKNNPVDKTTSALVKFGIKNKGNVITGDRSIGGSWDFLDYMTSQLTADVITSGGADWAIRALIKQTTEQGVPSTRVRSILDELQPEDFQTLKSAWNTREKAFENAKFYAQEATIRDMMPFIDTHEIRSQFADHGRGFMPFFYAEENFLKRWARIASMDSGMNGIAALRKFQLQYTGLREMGVIRQSETGDDYFVMPGTDLFIEGLENITGLNLGLTSMLTQPVNKMLPGIGPKFGAPSYSPLVIMPISFIAGRFPDFEPLQDLERNIIGEDNALDRNWYSHFLPTTMVNTVKAIKLASANQNELRQDEKLSSNLNVAMAHLMAQGKGPKPNATAAEQEEFLRDATNYARIIEITRLLGGWVSMAPAGTEINIGQDSSISWLTGGQITNPADLLRSEYYDMIREMGIDDGTVAYINTYIDSGKRFGIEDIFNPLAYTVSDSTSTSGAVIPTTKDAIQFYLDNKKVFSEYKLGGAWMLPGDPQSNNDFSQWAWNQSIVEGLRRRNTPQEVLNELMFREGATVYFAKKDEYETNALNAEASGDGAMAKTWREKWDRFALGWKASHPVFNDILGDNSRAVNRRNIIDEIQIIVKDPEFPKTDYSDSMKVLMQGWNAYMTTVGELSLNKTTAGRSRVAEERLMFQNWAESFIKEVPQLKAFWLSVLKPESGLD